MRRLHPIVVVTCSVVLLAGCFAPTDPGVNGGTSASDDDDDKGKSSAPDDDAESTASSEDDDDLVTTTTSGPDLVSTSSGSGSTSATTDAGTSTSGTTGSTSMDTTSTSTTTSTTEPEDVCTDIAPTDSDTIETCATWAYWGECDAEWFAGYCDRSCGRCVGGDDDGGDTGDFGPDLGDDNPYPPINGGSMGFTTRYWDCCKPSCSWPENGGAVSACNQSNQDVGVSGEGNACTGGSAFACHGNAPWAHSNKVSYGFAAVNGVGCGTCFQLEFTGATRNESGMDIGSQGLAGKTMIVMATNIGNIGQGQFDLLIPGGGVGDFDGCSRQWGVSENELGARYGGFMLACREQHGWSGPEAYEASRQCVRDRCEAVFGSRGLTDLYDGCMWYINWFRAADNPEMRYQQIDCPQELRDRAR